jgi:hypothetical protein
MEEETKFSPSCSKAEAARKKATDEFGNILDQKK